MPRPTTPSSPPDRVGSPRVKLLPDGRYYEELHRRLTAARRRVYVSMFLFSPRWYDKTLNLLADFTAASQRGLHCRLVLAAAPIKIGRRRPNQETAQRLLSAGWQVRVMTGNRTLHEKLILIDDQTVIFGSHNLAWSSIASNFELSVCIEDADLNRQAETLFWQRWQLASDPDPNLWELATPLVLPFVP